MTHNAIIYLRVSTEEQAIGYSLSTQIGACIAYAIRQGYTIVHEIKEHYSGHELQRPGLAELYAFIATHDVQFVIVYDPDRLSRGGPAHHSIIETRLATYGVKIVFAVIEQDSTDVFIDEFAKQNLGWYESKQRSRRVLNGKLNKVKAGNVMPGARPPFGYDYIGGELVVNQEEAAVVRKVYQYYLAGQSIREIARQLSHEQVPTKADKLKALTKHNEYGIWGPSTVRKLLGNESYTGKWFYNKTKTVRIDGKKRQTQRPKSEWVAVTIPALVELTAYQRVGAQLAANRDTQKQHVKRDYLLKGMIYCSCGLCCACDSGHGLTSYRCPVKVGDVWKRKCLIGFSTTAGKVEEAVWAAVATLLTNTAYLRIEIDQQRQRMATELEELSRQLDAIHTAKLDTERRLTLLLDDILDGYPYEILQERKQLLIDKLKQLNAEMLKVAAQLPSITITPEQEALLLQLSAQGQVAVQQLEIVQKREVLEMLQIRVEAMDRHQLQLTGMLNFANPIIQI